MEIFSHCDQMPQKVLREDDGSPNDDNDTDDECITPSREICTNLDEITTRVVCFV